MLPLTRLADDAFVAAPSPVAPGSAACGGAFPRGDQSSRAGPPRLAARRIPSEAAPRASADRYRRGRRRGVSKNITGTQGEEGGRVADRGGGGDILSTGVLLWERSRSCWRPAAAAAAGQLTLAVQQAVQQAARPVRFCSHRRPPATTSALLHRPRAVLKLAPGAAAPRLLLVPSLFP